jgi:hypothetical protein
MTLAFERPVVHLCTYSQLSLPENAEVHMHTHKHMHSNDQVFLYYCLAHALQVCYCLNGFSSMSHITVLLHILVIRPDTVLNFYDNMFQIHI